jgi:hypothetical protein
MTKTEAGYNLEELKGIVNFKNGKASAVVKNNSLYQPNYCSPKL